MDVSVVIIAVIIAVMLGEEPTHFMEEGEPLTWFSAFQLFAIALVCGRVLAIRKPEKLYLFWKSRGFIWLLLSLGFVFLAGDELLQFHENLDGFIHDAINLKQTNFTDRLDDLIILLYGIFFCIAGWSSQEELKHYRSVGKLLKLGIGLFLFMILFDAISNKSDIVTNKALNEWVGALEDGLKILAEGVFLSVASECLKIAKQLSFSKDKPRKNWLKVPNRLSWQNWLK